MSEMIVSRESALRCLPLLAALIALKVGGQTPSPTAATSTPTPTQRGPAALRPRAQLDPHTYYWFFTREFGLSYEYDEAVYPRTAPRDAPTTPDQYIRLEPGIKAELVKAKHTAEVSYRGSFDRYDDIRDRNSERHDGRLGWRGPLSPRLTANLRRRIYYLDDIGNDESGAVTRPTTYLLSETAGGLVYSATTKLQYLLDGQFTDIDYRSPFSQDSSEWSLTPRVRFILSATDSFDLSYKYNEYDIERYEQTVSHAAQLSATHRFSRDMFTTVGGGVTRFVNGDDEQTLSADIMLTRLIGTARLVVAYNRSDSLSRDPPEVVTRDRFSVTLTRPLGQVWSMVNTVSYLRDRSIESNRTDTKTLRVRVTLSRPLNPWTTLQVFGGYTEQKAEGQSGKNLDGYNVGVGVRVIW